jgi:chromate transport protein ChrA
MNSSFFGLIGVLPAIVALVAQWVGVMAMRDERNGAWWTMMVGTAMSTLGALGTIASMVMMFTNMRSSGFSGVNPTMLVFAAVAGMHTLGGLVFAAGFAMHGLRRKAAREREQQLETIAAAMGEELRTSRGDGR